MSYCVSRFQTIRRLSREVKVGPVGVGGSHPIRLQSMTTSDTQDVAATLQQSIALAEVGCEIVRITAPNVTAAKCLGEIRTRFTTAGFSHIPLVADIHFLPSAALEAVEHVEKIRINPGNYADKKKFAVREYSDADYDAELQRLHDAFSPLVKRCRELGRALRIGTNHGSLSDRIMNRHGDTPLGMVESALEFLRIAKAHSYHDIILSMKSSNPKVMIQAYRLLVERMARENMHYPLHLGVTEAGDGEDGRIKSAIGIGSLLLDGLGDTIRVSLTEDSIHEIPVARAIADKAMALWRGGPQSMTKAQCPMPDNGADRTNIGHWPLEIGHFESPSDSVDPYCYTKRPTTTLTLSARCLSGLEHPPRVIVRLPSPAALESAAPELASTKLKDTPAEGLLIPVTSVGDLATLCRVAARLALPADFLALDLAPSLTPDVLQPLLALSRGRIMLVRAFSAGDSATLQAFVELVRQHDQFLACEISAADLATLFPALPDIGRDRLVFTLAGPAANQDLAHATGRFRQLAAALRQFGLSAPIWIRNTAANAIQHENTFLSKLLEASFLTGSLLCDGLGDFVSLETEADPVRATQLAYNVLQGAGARISKTEFVACPSCGRTLFDLQTTTQRIRAQTGHLKGVKLAIMGCIVNGPGEMADADFGYVGGAPGKINLYVGKTCVQFNLPQEEADARLIALIKEHGKWVEPSEAQP